MTSNSVVGRGDCDDIILPDFNDLSNYCSLDDANISLNESHQRDLSVLYINIVSINSKMTDLLHFLSKFDKKPDLICLSETKITEKVNTNYNPHLDGYTFEKIKSKTHAGGVGIFYRNSLNCTMRSDLNCSIQGLFEMLWFDVSCSEQNNQKTTVGIIYRHRGEAAIPSFTSRMENVLNKLNREKANFYIFGDYNINLLKTDRIYNISEFVESMHSNGALNLVNKPTRFPIGAQRGGPSLLDHLWTNQPLRIDKIDLIVDPMSDHRPTLVIVKLNKNIMKNTSRDYFVRDMSNFDLEAFNHSLFSFFPTLLTISDIDQKFEYLQTHISRCINFHAPLRKRTKKELKFADKPWISDCIKISIDNKNRLYRILQNRDDAELKKKYNKIKKILKKTIFAAETKYYEYRFRESQKNSRKTWRLINEITCRIKRDNSSIKVLKTANGVTSDSKVIADTLNKYFTNVGKDMSSRLPDAPVSHQYFLKNRMQSSFYLTPTDPMEILDLIDEFSNKPPGTDKIPAKYVKLGAPALSNILSVLINECFSIGKFPHTLKIARLTPIHKDGPKDVSSNYRPISILSILSKLIEKLTYNRLIKYIDRNSILSRNQFGFRFAHSTTHAITSIHEKILENVNNNRHTISIYLDLSKAFDSVNHAILLNKLEHYGIRGVTLSFFKSYLSNRQQCTIVNGEISELLKVLCGVPQGSTLGPLLFLLYINDLANASNFFLSLFADDTCLLLDHENLGTLKHQCNAELVHINNWFLANKLTANLSKASKYMLTFGKRRVRYPHNFEIVMGNTVLEKVKSIKYLGVIFDERFRWHEHMAYISTKLACSVGILSKLRYYTNISTLIRVYHSLVCSHLNYALMTWGAAGKTVLQPLRVLQNRAIRFISRAPRFRRLDNDYLNLRLLKLDDLYHISACKFMHQYHNQKLPDYFSNFFIEAQPRRLNLRQNPLATLRPINCRKKIMERSIRFMGPKLWAKIPLSDRELSISKFKKEYANKLLAEY